MVVTKLNDNKDKAEFWRRQLELFTQYSGTQSAFCRERGFCPHLLHYWRKRLSGESRRRPPRIPTVSPFVPVTVERLPRVAPTLSLPNAKWLAELILHLQCGGEA